MNSHESNRAPAHGYDRSRTPPSFDGRDHIDVTGPEIPGREWWEWFWADALDRLKHHVERPA
jgi:hypothetical protein